MDWILPQRPSWMDAETYACMPERLTMRETEIGGRVLVTTLTDARMVSATEIDTLYGRRWQVEVDLRTQTPAMIDKEIAVYLLADNLICALMVRAAAGVRLKARPLSFKGSVQFYLAFEQQLRFGAGCVSAMTAHLLGGISMLRLPVRLRRLEPHAIKRRPKNHQLLTLPRDVARAAIRRSRSKTGLR